jgi:uncharacterized protein (TIGR00255 family)
MLKSMTGFGKAQIERHDVVVTAEIKTLNSKYLELNLRLPRAFSGKEIEIRNLLTAQLCRGKVNVVVEVQNNAKNNGDIAYNKQAFQHYYAQLKEMAQSVGASDTDLFRLALQQPDVSVSSGDELNDEEWVLVEEALLEAAGKCDAFRVREGHALRDKLLQYGHSIEQTLREIEKLDGQRLENVRVRLQKRLEELGAPERIDESRFEQEVLYYLEKLDISEEKVRLRTHLDYYEQTLTGLESNGKKLGFLAQEIGREINTIGSKANDAQIQKLVVLMKEELEKIKEQTLNIL